MIDAVSDAPAERLAAAEFLGRRSTPILAAALTTLAGGASMLLAKHPAVWSLGFALTTGVGASLLLTWLVIPPLMRRGREAGE
jgi:predicted RND superfamily exporter protein